MISLCDPLYAGRLWGQVGIDRPVDAGEPEEEHSADHADVTADGSRQAHRASGAPAETRGREEYAAAAHAAAPAESTEAATRRDRAAVGERDEPAERSREMWAEHQARWPAEKRPPVDRSGDPPGSWRGDSKRFLDSAANGHVEYRCDRIAKTERDIVSPAMQAVESAASDRHLIGFENRLKGRDRIKDKVAEQMEAQPDLTTDQAIATVKDAVRYTFRYAEDRYSLGVRADIDRIAAQGFQEVERRNSWTGDQYRGINSRWREPGTGLIFEVQFHTRNSFEAKQMTHGAYERLRDPRTTPAEQRELEQFQRYVCTNIPTPQHATEIANYP
jgi:hypothetical protein